MLSQMHEAKLRLWNNNWFDIYDFTVGKYGKNRPNFQNANSISNQATTIDKINR